MIRTRTLLAATLFAIANLASPPAHAGGNGTAESPATGQASVSITGHNPANPPMNAPESPAATPQSTSTRYMTAKPADSTQAVAAPKRSHHRVKKPAAP